MAAARMCEAEGKTRYLWMLIHRDHHIRGFDHRVSCFTYRYPEVFYRFLANIDVISIPPGSSRITSELTAPGMILTTLPFRTLRALSFMGEFLLVLFVYSCNDTTML